MSYANTKELKEDVLFRGGETLSGSPWDVKIIDYLNRVYRAVCSGASEFLPEYIDDWWWLRSSGVLTLSPAIETGTINLTQDSPNVTFSSAPASSVAGYRLRVTGWSEVFEILTHTGGASAAVLDSPYTGGTSTAAKYRLMRVHYPLGVTVAALLSPMIGFRDNPRIQGVSPERMDELAPLIDLNSGVPTMFALENEQTVRFSHGGRTDGKSMRIEYRFRPLVADLTDSTGSIPIVPAQWRHLLSDMALAYMLMDKNDDRSSGAVASAKTGLAAMAKENRRRLAKMGSNYGHIFPRQSMGMFPGRGPLRTESGLIIG